MRTIMPKTNILLLEDDLPLHETIKQFLEHGGYKVFSAFDALEAKDILYEQSIDLMLLDIKVPHQSGFDFLAEVRAEENNTPAIFITSLNAVDDVTRGFDVGCDDYIRKPFALKELLARVEVLLKRHFGTVQKEIDLGKGYRFDIKGIFLSHHGTKIPLKNKELTLLSLFLKEKNRLLSYEQIFQNVWSYDENPSQGSLRAYINTLRQHLGKESIETIKNMGYRYVSQ
jgi:DNA-binding response OmpR family regulator